MKSPFRNSNNTLRTKQLFVEYNRNPEREGAMYSISRIDKTRAIKTYDKLGNEQIIHKTYPSLFKLYMQENDPLEHEFALKYFESWFHWCEIANSSWMKPLLKQWREELELRIQSDALKAIQAEAINDTKYSYAANLYLAKKSWKEPKPKTEENTTRSTRGRPSKAQIAEEASKMAMAQHDVFEDLKRLGLNLKAS